MCKKKQRFWTTHQGISIKEKPTEQVLDTDNIVNV